MSEKPLEFIKYRTLEVKNVPSTDFILHSYGNDLIIQSPSTKAIALTLTNEPDVAELFPYAITNVTIPKDRPITNLIEGIDLRRIYTNAVVQAQQELALDPIILANLSVEPTKPRLSQAHFAPMGCGERNPQPLLAIITTYGACLVLTKRRDERSWQHVANLTKLLITEVFPVSTSPSGIKTFPQLRSFVEQYCITACTWHENGQLIYVTDSAGYLTAFQYSMDELQLTDVEMPFRYYCKSQLHMGRICYLKAFDDYLLVSGVTGALGLFQLVHKDSTDAAFESKEMLCSHLDLMNCRQIEVQKCNDFHGYTIFCAKGAIALFFLLSKNGKLVASAETRIPTVQITGLASLAKNQFLLTTLTGSVMHLHLSYNIEGGLPQSPQLRVERVNLPEVDAANFKILGIAATINKALWSFVLHRNKPTAITAKKSEKIFNIMLCIPNTIEPVEQLKSTSIDTMDPYLDLVIALRLQCWHDEKLEIRNRHMPFGLEKLVPPAQIDGEFLRELQLRLEISRTLLNNINFKLRFIDVNISTEIAFLELIIQVTHILLRLEYLRNLSNTAGLHSLTDFQRLAADCMRSKFKSLIAELKTATENVPDQFPTINKFKEIVLGFIGLAAVAFLEKLQDNEMPSTGTRFEEKCTICNQVLCEDGRMCPNSHIVTRCSVSYVQLPLFGNRFCGQCKIAAYAPIIHSQDPLTELFPTNERVKCTLCRFKFICDDD